MPSPETLPIVAIVGRPNVGKSTLFNRYAGKRRVLVEDTPGITRDRIVEEVEVGARRILVVDTAGLDPDAEAGLPAAIQIQAREAVAEADAILFVVDGQEGLLPEDAVLAQELRRTRKPVAVAVNKIDVLQHEPRALEFHALGLERLHPVSAEHGRGAWDLLEELAAELPPAETSPEPAPTDAIHVAFVGHPNVGKSSLVNRLLGSDRVVVSEVPGTTRDAIDTHFESADGSFVLVDTAGLRRPGRRGGGAERGSALMTVRAIERAEIACVVIDAGAGLTDQDVRIAGLVRARGCAAAIVANKWDLLSGGEESAAERLEEEIARRLRFMADTPMLRVSAKTGARIGRILPLASRLGNTTRREIPTAELNRWLKEAVARHEPAMAQRGSRRRRVKFFYATQARVRPPTFVLFCTDPEAVRPAYRRYLEKRLRERFELVGTPVRLWLRTRHGKDPH